METSPPINPVVTAKNGAPAPAATAAIKPSRGGPRPRLRIPGWVVLARTVHSLLVPGVDAKPNYLRSNQTWFVFISHVI